MKTPIFLSSIPKLLLKMRKMCNCDICVATHFSLSSPKMTLKMKNLNFSICYPQVTTKMGKMCKCVIFVDTHLSPGFPKMTMKMKTLNFSIRYPHPKLPTKKL